MKIQALLPVLALLAASACREVNDPAPTPQPMSAGAGPVESPFDAKLREVAATYLEYGRVDDEGRWAPWLCRMPNPSHARFSKSDEEATHGRKLYYLFAKDRAAYVALGDQSDGQAIVKESWTPAPAEPGATPQPVFTPGGEWGDRHVPFATREGTLYRADKKAGLFVMLKVDPSLPGTDEGWVYGTLTPDGKTVTSSGRVASCMGCHTEAPHGRLFGLK